MFSMSLFVLMFLSFGHCVVCLSSIYRFCGIFKFFIFQFENNRYLYYMSFITDLIIFMWPMNCVCMIIFVSGLAWFGFMVFNASFNNISAISWRSVLWVEETGVPGKTIDLQQIIDNLYHILLYISPWTNYNSQHQWW
jgi:hypothetical protein